MLNKNMLNKDNCYYDPYDPERVYSEEDVYEDSDFSAVGTGMLTKWLEAVSFIDSLYSKIPPTLCLALKKKGMALAVNTPRVSYYINPDRITQYVVTLSMYSKRLLYNYLLYLSQIRCSKVLIISGNKLRAKNFKESLIEISDYGLETVTKGIPSTTVLPMPAATISTIVSPDTLAIKAKTTKTKNYLNILQNGTIEFSYKPLDEAAASTKVNPKIIYAILKKLDRKDNKAVIHLAPELKKSLIITGYVHGHPIRAHVKPL